MRKVKSLQHLSHGTTDYPTHSRKILTVVDQQGLESQMPEHVTLSPPHRGHVRKQHMYEQIELEEQGMVRHHPQEVEGLVASVKRSNRWSPGLPKHQQEQPRGGRRRSVPSRISAGIMATGDRYLPGNGLRESLDTVSLQDCDLVCSVRTKPMVSCTPPGVRS